MNKFDLAFKVAIVGLLAIVAYQQFGIKKELALISDLTDSIKKHIPDTRATISVAVVNNEKAPIPVSIIEPTTTVLRYGMRLKAVAVDAP